MKEIIVNTRNKQCRFHSVEEMVGYYVETGVAYNVRFALRDVVQCNAEYRGFLREKGYQATVERLKAEAPSLLRIPDAFDTLDSWWPKTEERGGLGDYDIQCYELTDTFTLLGEKFNGLKSIRDIVNVSRANQDNNPLDKEWDEYTRMSDEKRYPDNRKNRKSSLYAAEIWERYPCFDSADLLCEDRHFWCYFIRNHRINNEFCKDMPLVHYRDLIREDIDLSELPIVYYDGDSRVMYVISPR